MADDALLSVHSPTSTNAGLREGIVVRGAGRGLPAVPENLDVRIPSFPEEPPEQRE